MLRFTLVSIVNYVISSVFLDSKILKNLSKFSTKKKCEKSHGKIEKWYGQILHAVCEKKRISFAGKLNSRQMKPT